MIELKHMDQLENESPQPNIPEQQPQPEVPQKSSMPTWGIILITVLSLTIIGGGGYAAYQYYSNPEPVACTLDAKICPDGSSVGRIAPDCEFAECPEVIDPKADWQTYRNEEYGFELEYPEGYSINKDVFNDIFIKDNDSKEIGHIGISSKGKVGNLSLLDFARQGISPLDKIKTKTEETLDIAGLNSVKQVVTFTQQDERVKDSVIYYFDGSKNYIRIYFNMTDDLGMIEQNEKILSTFKFIEIDETVSWQTYRNEKYKYEIKYPASWQTAYGFEVIQPIGDEKIINFIDANNIFNWVSIEIPLTVNIPIENENNIKINNINFYRSTYGSEPNGDPVVFFAIDRVGTYRFLFNGFYGKNPEEFYKNILSTFKFIE